MDRIFGTTSALRRVVSEEKEGGRGTETQSAKGRNGAMMVFAREINKTNHENTKTNHF